MCEGVELKTDRHTAVVHPEGDHPFSDSACCFWPRVVVMVNPAGVVDRDSVLAAIYQHWSSSDDDDVSGVSRLLCRCGERPRDNVAPLRLRKSIDRFPSGHGIARQAVQEVESTSPLLGGDDQVQLVDRRIVPEQLVLANSRRTRSNPCRRCLQMGRRAFCAGSGFRGCRLTISQRHRQYFRHG